MVRGDLVKIIQSYQSQGYSAAQIAQGLQTAGWLQSDIDEAFAFIQPSNPSTRPWILAASVALAFVVILIAAFLLLLAPSRPSQLLDVSVEPVRTEVSASSPIEFIIQLVNLGSASRFDVHIKSELVSVASNEVVAAKTETVAIETRNAVKSQLVVPADANPGRYVVRVLVEYARQSARASFSLVVIPPEKILPKPPVSPSGQHDSDDCQGGCNDYDSCTLDRCVKGVCIFDKISPCCGNGVCERGESETFCPEDCAEKRPTVAQSVQVIIDKAFSAASTDPDSGVRLCRTLPQLSDQGACLSGVAKRSGQAEICGQIVEDKDKDGCYLDFALGRDRFDLCDQVQDRWLKSSCYSYANLKKSGK